MFAPTYLDHNATTPLDERVLEVMLPFLRERCGNPSSRHEYGRATRDAVERARQQVASAVNAHPTEVIFTSGGSEANNLFLKGAASSLKPGVLAIGASEHPCVHQPALQLRAQGWKLLELPLDADGVVADRRDLIAQERPALVSVMLANNETGAINDIVTLAKVARAAGAYIHSDAVQALGKIPVDFRALGVHALSLSSHKIYGPLGAGALVLDKRVELQPLIAGGGQERGLRSGTENVAAIVGFGKACELLMAEYAQRAESMQRLRELLEKGLAHLGARIFAANAPRLPNTSFFAFGGIDGETLVGKLDRAGFAVASGAACSSAHPEPSRTLLAMSENPEIARGAVRISVGRTTQTQDVEKFLLALRQTVSELKQLTAMAV
ncbi:cysteine desulfurase family protein [Uliginosibacterium sp. 31-16]|uniref:cysteine desulfurase family protein n=1 Tax=Uliginosibacterium sp. 31-16 TaxID=3068315 RepID=UPI00273FE10A|nr:cysteine desulfurase family protein [Uliginosibacterium sp. 31-16]MDP5239532.1 cysteine desulfurase family protein [Uliginosibacterium sp. 31-16]